MARMTPPLRLFILAGLLLCGMRAAAQPAPPPVADTMAQRMQACVVCHGREGRATNAGYFPRIAGKPAGYLFNQLQNFREGRRHNLAMNHLMQHMSDDYLREIAAYFAGLDLPYPPAQPEALDAAQRRLAETLVFEGVPARQIPACVACHGRAMAGRQPAMPGLLTLPADYLMGQLGAWRTGQRRAHAPDCMAEVAKRLTAEEVGAVSRWLSAQTLPAGTHPEPASAEPLPMRCGSGER
jgi:cytochrome c553